MVPCSYLRVFQPLDAFPPHEQAEWERYIVAGGRPEPAKPRYHQRETPEHLGVLASAEGERAEIRLVDGDYHVSPSRTRLRVLASMLALRESAPFETSEHFVPEDEAKRAARELTRMRRRDPGQISFTMQSPWHVPVRWFVLFDDGERNLEQREDGEFRLSYRTTARKAVRRAERAAPVLRKSDLGTIADMLIELIEWLTSFDHRSLLELDYDGLCDLMSWDELDDDHSAKEIHEAMHALSKEEFPRSAELYQSVVGRWAEVRSHEMLN